MQYLYQPNKELHFIDWVEILINQLKISFVNILMSISATLPLYLTTVTGQQASTKRLQKCVQRQGRMAWIQRLCVRTAARQDGECHSAGWVSTQGEPVHLQQLTRQQ